MLLPLALMDLHKVIHNHPELLNKQIKTPMDLLKVIPNQPMLLNRLIKTPMDLHKHHRLVHPTPMARPRPALLA
jgi:hypothetical protein